MESWKFEPAHDIGLSPGDRWRSLGREKGLVSLGMSLTWWTVIRCYLSMWHRVRIENAHRLPQKLPFVMISNHTSHLDVLALVSALNWDLWPRVFPIAAGDVFFEKPLMSAFSATFLNALPMWRKKCGPHALQELRKRLVEEPCGYVVFPEGTRSRTGELLPFKLGLGMMIAGTEVPIIPCHLDGCHQAFNPGSRFPRRHPIWLRVGEAVQFQHVRNDREGWQLIVNEVYSRVNELAHSVR